MGTGLFKGEKIPQSSGYLIVSLQAKCKELCLEEEYKKYQIRLMISYLTVFFPLFIFVVVGCELCPWIFSEVRAQT